MSINWSKSKPKKKSKCLKLRQNSIERQEPNLLICWERKDLCSVSLLGPMKTLPEVPDSPHPAAVRAVICPDSANTTALTSMLQVSGFLPWIPRNYYRPFWARFSFAPNKLPIEEKNQIPLLDLHPVNLGMSFFLLSPDWDLWPFTKGKEKENQLKV